MTTEKDESFFDSVVTKTVDGFVVSSSSYRSVNFEMSFWCLQFFQKTNLKIQLFALVYWGRNFSFNFWKNWKNQNVLSKLSDLYRGGKIIFPSKPSLLAVQPKEESTLPKKNKEQKSKKFVVPSWFTKLTQRYVERQKRTAKGFVM